MKTQHILPLRQVGINDIDRVGGKNASLGEMLQHLSPLGINIPDGFVITVEAYKYFMAHNGLDMLIRENLEGLDVQHIELLRRTGLHIRNAVRNASFPAELAQEIEDSYKELSMQYGQAATDVAVRSSATAEDLPDASFAGQQETYLNVRGAADLVESVRNCFASMFTDRAIAYREAFGYDHFTGGLSVCVQKMVRSDLGASGVAFSLDTESGFREVVLINGSYGLGELVVQGAVLPDEYIVHKPTLRQGFDSLIEKKMGVKDKMMVYGDDANERVKVIPTEKHFRDRFCLKDATAIRLASWVMRIEEYYSTLKKKWTPMDVEWAVDGLSRELFIVQARPETIHSQKSATSITQYRLASEEGENRKLLVSGIAVGDKIAAGQVNILYSLDKRVAEGHEFKPGDVLVTDMTDPDWEPIMKIASAIVTNKGGRTCHAAIVAREMGLPAIVGCGNATEILKTGQAITVSCAEGEQGFVYDGRLGYEKMEHDLAALPSTKTDLMLNVGSPSHCFQYAAFPARGVGLAREEFIINNYIQAHPLALLEHATVGDTALSDSIGRLITGFADERDYFISKLSYGIAKIAAAFYPHKVIVRFSDFKSNEYANLLGGKYFEPEEENPMIGWRGASRYYSNKYRQAFGLECAAIKRVREEMGLANVVVMIPFCRTVPELLKVKQVMAEHGLVHGSNGLELYLMAELPSNVLLADDFALHVDGFSIGSNDLTQLTLGLDRDSALVSDLYDERNEAVKAMVSMLIKSAKRNGVKVGICGQGPSDFPDFAAFLVSEGINSISVTPDALLKVVHAVSQAELRMAEKDIPHAMEVS